MPAPMLTAQLVDAVGLPLGTLPPLLTGQTAVLSTTLNVGDRV
jgi:hypothetical protein